jgi:hypothetical protein
MDLLNIKYDFYINIPSSLEHQSVLYFKVPLVIVNFGKTVTSIYVHKWLKLILFLHYRVFTNNNTRWLQQEICFSRYSIVILCRIKFFLDSSTS